VYDYQSIIFPDIFTYSVKSILKAVAVSWQFYWRVALTMRNNHYDEHPKLNINDEQAISSGCPE